MIRMLMEWKKVYLGSKGQGIVEYALILAFVLLIAAGLTVAGGNSLAAAVQSVFTSVVTALGYTAP